MRKIIRPALCIALILVLAAMVCASALADVDLDKTGSVSLRIHTREDVNVKNAHIELYRIATPAIEDHNLRFKLSGAFEKCNVSLNDLSDTGIAAALASWIKENNVAPLMQADTDSDGKASFNSLSSGLYLIAQNGFAKGKSGAFSQIMPFIATLPMTDESGTKWIYDIDAQPKVNPISTPAPTVKPTSPPSDVTLPQTGMLRWPIPVLGVSGIVLFCIGWALFFGKKKAD